MSWAFNNFRGDFFRPGHSCFARPEKVGHPRFAHVSRVHPPVSLGWPKFDGADYKISLNAKNSKGAMSVCFVVSLLSLAAVTEYSLLLLHKQPLVRPQTM